MCVISFILMMWQQGEGFLIYITDNVRTEGLLEPPDKLMELSKAINTIAVSTAECKRGFSQMNILAS